MARATRSTILRTKLHPPRVAAHVVDRPRLWRKLDSGLELPLTLVSAPAGYGKTTLVAGWLPTTGRRYVWLSLDEGDSDLMGFLRYFLEALGTLAPHACPESRTTLEMADLPPVALIADVITNEIDALDENFILVLDDYHFIHDSAVHDLLSLLMKHPPRPLHLVILSRSDPPLPLARLRLRGQMTEIRHVDLQFTGAETQGFFQQSLERPLETGALERLRETTEGWAVGLQLAALSLRYRSDVNGFLADIQGDFLRAQDYLLAEVLSQQPPEYQQRLLKISVVDRFCSPLCDALFSRTAGGDGVELSSEAFLHWLARSNLFVTSLDDRDEWYRFHALFRDALQRQLQESLGPEEIEDLHRSAALWLQAEGYHEEALSHYLACNDTDAAADLVNHHRYALMDREEWHRLDRWVHLLPEAVVREDVGLQVLLAWICENRFRYGEMVQVLREIAPLLADLPPGESTSRLRAEFDALGSAERYFAGDGAAAVAQARRALDTLAPERLSERGFALVVLAFAYQMCGDFEQAQAVALGAMQDKSRRGSTFHTRILIALCFVYWMEANVAQVLRFAQELLRLGQQHHLLESVSFARYFLGLGHWDRGDPVTAEEVLAPNLSQRIHVNTTNFAYSALALALVYAASAPQRAREIAARVARFGLELGNPELIALTGAFEAELALRQGRTAEASQWAQTFEPTLEGPRWRCFLPELTFVRVLLAEGTDRSRERAANTLDRLHHSFSAAHNRRFLIDVLALRAALRDQQGSEAAALDDLEQAVELAEPRELVRPFLDLAPQMTGLARRLDPGSQTRTFLDGVLGAVSLQTPQESGDAQPGEATTRTVPISPPSRDALTDRELQVLDLLAERLSNKEIAARLFISPITVKRHTINIYQKLQVNRRREAVSRARSLGILSTPD